MFVNESLGELLDSVARVLIRCFFMGMVILLFWWGLILLAGDFALNIHSQLFHLSSQQFYAINYAGLMFTKVTIFLLFLLPYIAVKLVMRR